jgi:hypothetical protein
MKIPVIRDLAAKHDFDTLIEAAQKFELNRENSLQVKGDDEGEILTHILLAARIREKMNQGIALNDAIRDESRAIQNLLQVKKNKNHTSK